MVGSAFWRNVWRQERRTRKGAEKSSSFVGFGLWQLWEENPGAGGCEITEIDGFADRGLLCLLRTFWKTDPLGKRDAAFAPAK